MTVSCRLGHHYLLKALTLVLMTYFHQVPCQEDYALFLCKVIYLFRIGTECLHPSIGSHKHLHQLHYSTLFCTTNDCSRKKSVCDSFISQALFP